MTQKQLRILVVDDSATYRKLISTAVSQLSPEYIVETAATGPIALSKLRANPADLVLCDIFMPEMNGPEVLNHIRREFPRTTVVMISGATGRDADVTINCLNNGALDFIAKPQNASFEKSMEEVVGHLRRVLQVVRLRSGMGPQPGIAAPRPGAATAPGAPAPPGFLRPGPAAPTPAAPAFPAFQRPGVAAPVQPAPGPAPAAPPAFRRPGLAGAPPARPELLLIGVSTGGPRALQELLPTLPARFPAPVLLVQHMPPMFTKSLADQLDRACQLRVIEASHGEAVQPGTVYIAPGGRHLELARPGGPNGPLFTQLTDSPPVLSCRPAVNVLFQSAAALKPRSAIAVILTGMGEDGADGVAALKQSIPTWCIAQDAATSVVYGMPMAVAERGLADEILPLPQIGPRLKEIFGVF